MALSQIFSLVILLASVDPACASRQFRPSDESKDDVEAFLNDFKKDEASEGAKNMAKTILSGVEQAFNGSSGSSGSLPGWRVNATYDEENNMLRLNLPQAVQGEIATKSRVPIKWIVDRDASFQVVMPPNPTIPLRLVTKGLFASPFEGLQLYEDSRASQGFNVTIWDGKTKREKEKEAKKEADAVYEYFESKIKRTGLMSGYKAQYYFDDSWLNNATHKLSRVWHTIREMAQYGMKPTKADGSKALYSMVIGIPMRITEFDFADYKSSGVRVALQVAMDAHNLTVNVNGQAVNAADYCAEKRIEEKAVLFFDPENFPWQRKLAEKFAPSAMSYAAALAAGNPQITNKNGGEALEGGKVAKVAKLFMPCQVMPSADQTGWLSHDETWNCRGSEPGRVIWKVM